MLHHRGALVLTGLALALGAPAARDAEAQAPAYLTPPKAIVDILDAPWIPTAALSPSRDVVVLLETRSAPRIAELAEPMLRLGGLRCRWSTGERKNPKFGLDMF